MNYEEMTTGDNSLKPPVVQPPDPEKKSSFSGIFSSFKKPSSHKSGNAGSSKKSAGAGSVATTLSDLEKIEKILNEAQFADKSIVKYFGKHFEEFRREMHYNKEIIFADQML